MNCVIRGIFQKMDFENNTLQNYLTVILPTGEAIQCLIEDAVAERVVAAHTKTQEKPPTPVMSAVLDGTVFEPSPSLAGFVTSTAHTRPPVTADTEQADPPALSDDPDNQENEDDGVPSV
jgi:hypothetical protein